MQFTGIPYSTFGNDYFMFLDDALFYFPIRSYSDVPYADADITLLSDTAHNHYDIKESSSLNSYFNVAAFTDIQGLGGAPNGVAQFQGEGKFITNTSTIGQGATTYLSYIAFEGRLSKYDSQFKGSMAFQSAAKKDSISRLSLFQRSTYSIGLKLNLLQGFQSPRPAHLISNWQLNIGLNFIGGNVADTSFKDVAHTVIDTTYRTVTQKDFYIEPLLTIARHQNFALTASLPVHFVSVAGNANIRNSSLEHWIAPTIELMYFARKDSNSKLFFRYRFYSNMDNNTQGFTQIQFGYSVNLSTVWTPPVSQ